MSLQVGKYQLLDRIGSGGMAEIHLARVTGAAGFEKLVVVKRLLPDLAEEKEFVDQFKDEARLAASFSHANIVTTFDFGEADGNYYLAMEYVEGKNLRRIADSLEKRGKKLPEPAAVHIIAETCRGLDYAHQRKDSSGRVLGIVHRDVSPQNIVVSYSGDVKVLDFGIAKSAAREYHTAAGIVKGKLRYMAPEQVTGEPIDGRADLFAAAVVLWELLYGRRVMPDLPDTELVEWVQKGEFVRPPNVETGWEIDSVLAKALEVNPEHRYATCSEFAAALNRHNIQHWPHWTPNELGKLLETEFADDARREREWIAHIVGQIAEKQAVQIAVSIPSSMQVVEAPSRDEVPTTKTPTGQKRGQATVLRPMEPDSGNTLSGFHVKAKDSPGGVGPVPIAPASTPSRVGMLPPSRPASPSNPAASVPAAAAKSPLAPEPPSDRGANTEVSIPMVRGTAVAPLGPGGVTVTADEKRTRPWMLLGGIGGGAVIAAVAAMFVLPLVLESPSATPSPTITPIGLNSPTATATPAASETVAVSSPVTTATATPAPSRTAMVQVTPTPRVTPTRTATPRPTRTATPVATQVAAVKTGYLSVNVTQGWASVYINGKLVKDETPLQKLNLPVGRYSVTVKKNGRESPPQLITLTAGEMRVLLFEPP